MFCADVDDAVQPLYGISMLKESAPPLIHSMITALKGREPVTVEVERDGGRALPILPTVFVTVNSGVAAKSCCAVRSASRGVPPVAQYCHVVNSRPLFPPHHVAKTCSPVAAASRRDTRQ